MQFTHFFIIIIIIQNVFVLLALLDIFEFV